MQDSSQEVEQLTQETGVGLLQQAGPPVCAPVSRGDMVPGPSVADAATAPSPSSPSPVLSRRGRRRPASPSPAQRQRGLETMGWLEPMLRQYEESEHEEDNVEEGLTRASESEVDGRRVSVAWGSVLGTIEQVCKRRNIEIERDLIEYDKKLERIQIMKAKLKEEKNFNNKIIEGRKSNEKE